MTTAMATAVPAQRILPTRATALRAARGFTLVEMLVALAIVALALAAGHKASGALIRSTERQDDILLATLCADNALVHLRLTRQLPGIGSSLSTCEQANRHYDLQVRVSGTTNPSFRRVDAQVWREGTSVLTLSTIMGQF